MDNEKELVRFILQYLLDNHFESKSDMERQLDIRHRTMQCECQRKSEPSANQYLSHLCERILEPPTPKVTANT